MLSTMVLVLQLDRSTDSLKRSDAGAPGLKMLEVTPGQQLGLESPTVAARVFKRQAMTENVGQTQHPVNPCV